MLRRIALITLTALTSLCLLGWLASYFWYVDLIVPLPYGNTYEEANLQQIPGRITLKLTSGSVWSDPMLYFDSKFAWPNSESLVSSTIPWYRSEDFPYFDWDSGSYYGLHGGFYFASLVFPHAVPAGILGIWPAIALIQYRRARRKRGPHCPQCDYDLRGSAGNATCPECGHAIAEDRSATV